MARRRRWVFVSASQFGHLLSQLGVVAELVRRGDEVYMPAIAKVAGHVASAGATPVLVDQGEDLDIVSSMERERARSQYRALERLPSAARAFAERRERELRFRRTVAAVAERTARAVEGLARKHRIDGVVADVLGFGARFGAELAGVPFATIAMDPVFALAGNTMPVHLPDPRAAAVPAAIWHRLVDLALPTARVRRRLGLARAAEAPVADFYGLMASPWLHVIPAPSWFMGTSPGRAHLYTGPMSYTPPRAGDDAAAKLHTTRKTVLVTGSTTGHPGGRRMLRSVVDAANRTSLDIIVAAGPVGEMFGKVSANVRIIEGFVDHGALIDRVGAVVSHGGWGVVGRTLKAGVPALVVPAFGPQFAIGERVRATGLGGVLQIDEVTPDSLQTTLERLLTSDTVKRRTAEVARELDAVDPVARAADALHELADGKLF